MKQFCKNGHERTFENLTKGSKCKICQKEYRKQYYLNNIEKEKEQTKQWRLDYPDYDKKWQQNNKEKVKIKSKKWQQNNSEKTKKLHKQWYLKNLEHYKKINKLWRKANPEKCLINIQKRRALKFKAYVSKVIPYEIFYRDLFMCKLCNKPLDMKAKAPESLSPSIDHIIPLSKGGTHEPANCQAAHLRCNISKGNRI